MPIKFQYNKTSLNEITKQLKVRLNALPTLKNKESALRLEVGRAKERAEKLLSQLEEAMAKYDSIAALWNEFDPGLIERALYAFGLLEAIKSVGMPFCFKGGTSLMLILDKPARLSTDIDILVEPGTDVDGYIEKASQIFPFLNKEEDVRVGAASGFPDSLLRRSAERILPVPGFLLHVGLGQGPEDLRMRPFGIVASE